MGAFCKWLIFYNVAINIIIFPLWIPLNWVDPCNQIGSTKLILGDSFCKLVKLCFVWKQLQSSLMSNKQSFIQKERPFTFATLSYVRIIATIAKKLFT
jgi:hypothetical protein